MVKHPAASSYAAETQRNVDNLKEIGILRAADSQAALFPAIIQTNHVCLFDCTCLGMLLQCD